MGFDKVKPKSQIRYKIHLNMVLALNKKKKK